MKKILIISTLLIAFFSSFAQSDVNTHKLTVRDSLKLKSRFVTDITDDTTLSTISHKKLATEYAIYWFVLHHMGSGGSNSTVFDTTFIRLPLKHGVNLITGNDTLYVDTTNISYGLATIYQLSKKLNIADLQAGTNVTITGAGTPGSPYVINSTATGGLITAVDTLWETPGKDSIQFTIASRYHAILNTDTAYIANYFFRRKDTTLIQNFINIAGLLSPGTNVTITGAGTKASPYVVNSNATGLITPGTNVTITGSGTPGSPYVINSTPGVITETDPVVKAINGIVKSDGTTIGPVVSGTDIKTINGNSILGPGNLVISGGGGLASTNFVFLETPSGSINSSNVTFTLANTPVTGTENLFLNGLELVRGGGNDYTISGSTITFITAPTTGDVLTANYLK